MTKPDLRKKIKLTIKTTHRDLCLLEDFNTTIPSCKKHNAMLDKHTEKELMVMYYDCKDCKKVFSRQLKASQRIEWALWRQMCDLYGWD